MFACTIIIIDRDCEKSPLVVQKNNNKQLTALFFSCRYKAYNKFYQVCRWGSILVQSYSLFPNIFGWYHSVMITPIILGVTNAIKTARWNFSLGYVYTSIHELYISNWQALRNVSITTLGNLLHYSYKKSEQQFERGLRLQNKSV